MEIISFLVTAIATALIAWVSWSNLMLTKALKENSDKHQEELRDLFQAIVVATVVTQMGKEDAHLNVINEFNRYYKGKFKFF